MGMTLERLDFLSVGVMATDPDDIEFRYIVDCGILDNGFPIVRCENKAGVEYDIPAKVLLRGSNGALFTNCSSDDYNS